MVNQISEKALTYIKKVIGSPYERDCYDGKSFDCWSLIYWIYKQENIDLPKRMSETWTPRNVRKQVKEWRSDWIKVTSYQYLDVILFSTSGRMATHVGMVLDKTKFIHARSEVGVTVGKLNKGRFAAQIKKVYRCKLTL